MVVGLFSIRQAGVNVTLVNNAAGVIHAGRRPISCRTTSTSS
jgi:hypothetical protein